MLKRFAIGFVCLLAIVNFCTSQSSNAAAGATPKTPADFFSLAAKQADIRAAGSPPFRLNATYTTTDDKGQVNTGGYSELWISKDRWRRDLTASTRKEADACVLGNYYSSASGGSIDDFIENLTPSVPEVKDTDDVNRVWSLDPQKINGVPILRVVHFMTFSEAGRVPESAYVFTPDEGYLLGIASLSQSVLYTKLHAISGRIVPYAVNIKYPGTKRSLEISITSFGATENPSDDSLILPGSAKGKCSDGRQLLDSKVISGNVISRVQPNYPEEARRNHQGGTVVLRVTIGRNGEVRNIHIVSSPRADLAASAIAAVRGYKYTPFLRDGVPVEVNGTINVNYVSQ